MASIKIDFRGDNSNFLNSLRGVRQGINETMQSIERSGQKASSSLESTFQKMKDGFTSFASGMLGFNALMNGWNFLSTLVDDIGAFTVAMKEVSTLSQDVTRDLEGWKQKIVDVTTQIPIGATEAAKAMYQIESAGHHGEDALNILQESAKGAIGGVTETFTTADAITTILNSYTMSASEAAHVNDLLFTTVKLGKTSMGELARSIAQVAPVAATYGVSIEDVLAATATLTKSGTPTSIAVRQVRDSIIATTKSLGDAAFKGKSFIDAMEQVADASNGSNNALRKELSNLQALNGVLGLTGKNAAGARQDLADMQDSAGAASEAYEKMADTAGNSAQLLKNNIFKYFESMGDSFLSFRKSMTDALNEGFDTGAIDSAVHAIEGLIAVYAMYQAYIYGTGVINKINVDTMTDGYARQIVTLDELIAEQGREVNAVTAEMVAKGQLTAEQAELITSLQSEVVARQEQLTAAAEAALGEADAAIAAEVAAQGNLAAAEELVASAEARMTAAKAAGVQTEIDAATVEMNTAAIMKNNAASELAAATHTREIAVNKAQTASKTAETAARVIEAGAENAETVSTGLLASAKMLAKKAQDAWNASMFASPIFWIAAVIAGVCYAVYELATAESAHDKAVRETNEALEEQKKMLDERKSETQKLIGIIQDQNATEFDKVRAYNQLKEVAPEITKEYSRQALAALETADAQKLLNETMNNAEYNEAVKNVNEMEAKISELNEQIRTATKNGGGQGIQGLYNLRDDYMTKLEQYKQHLQEIVDIRKQVADEEAEKLKPIEVQIKEAEENAQVKQDIADWWDEVGVKIYDLSEWHINQDFDQSVENLDNYIADVEKKLSDLQADLDKKPLDEGLRLKWSEGQKILNTLQDMRSMWINSGATSLPLMFKIQLQGAAQLSKAQADEAQQQVKTLQSQQGTGSGKTKTTGSGKGKKKTTKKSPGKSDADKKAQELREQQRLEDLKRKQKKEQARKSIDLEYDTAQAEIDAMKDSTEKVLRQLALDYKRRETEIDREYEDLKQKKIDDARALWEADPKNKGKKFDESSVDTSYTQKELDYFANQRKANTANYNQQLAERATADRQAMLDYLKEFGTFEQQKLAIAEDYEAKIREAQTEGEKLTLAKQQQNDLKEVEANAIMAKVDWYSVFDNVGLVMKSQLEPMLASLKEFTTTDKFQSLDADSQKRITEAIENIRKSIGTTADVGWKDLAAGITDYQNALREQLAAQTAFDQLLTQTTPALAEARKQLEEAKKSTDPEKIKAAQDAVEALEAPLRTAGDALDAANKKVVTSGTKLSSTAKDVMQPVSEIYTFLNDAGISQLAELWESIDKLKGGIDALKAISEAAKNVGEVGETISDATEETADAVGEVGEVIGDTLAEGLNKAGAIGQIVAAVLKILDILKDGISVLISSLIDSILGAINGILEDILSLKFFENIGGSLIKGIGGILDTITGYLGNALTFGLLSHEGISSWFTNSNAKEVQETTDRLTKSNDGLKNSIDKLKDSIDKTNGGDAIQDYEDAYKAQELVNKQQLEILKAQMSYHNAHHSNASNWDLSYSQYAKINRLLGTNVKSLNDLYKLSPEQMDKIRTYLRDVWDDMLNQGKYDKSEYWEAYADEAGKLEELTEKISENLTQTSFDSLRDNFVSALMDMDKKAADFGQDFEKYMMQALLNFAVGEELDKNLREWYDNWAKTMKAQNGKLSADQIAEYRRQWENFVNQGIETRDQIAELTGYNSDSQYSQEATSKGFGAMNQDTAEQLNGRFTALQIAGENVSTQIMYVVDYMASMATLTTARNQTLTEIRNMIFISNGFLEDIAKYTKITTAFGDKLDKLVDQTKNL